MNEKAKTGGLSIAMIILVIVIGFGFVIGLTQTNSANNLKDTKTEISNYLFDEEGTLLSYIGTKTDLEIPATYSLSNTVEEVQMSSTSIYTLIEKANKMNIKTYKIDNQTGYQKDDFGNQFYQDKYVLTYTRRPVIEGSDYTVKTIGAQAFMNNNNITSVVLPDTVTSISSSAFSGCTRLKTFTFSNNLQRIENAAFSNCIQMTNIELPDSITYLGPQAFQDCDGLKTINIPQSLTELPSMVFQNCDGLTEITIPSNINYIGSDAFYYCRNLRTINIEDGVGYIGQNAFYFCRSLQSITLPSSVYYIGHQAFWNCNNLRTVIVNAVQVPDIEPNAFYNAYISKIYVLDELFDEYMFYGNWPAYSSRLTRMSELQQ